jgi:hypothetical protein
MFHYYSAVLVISSMCQPGQVQEAKQAAEKALLAAEKALSIAAEKALS